MSSLIVSRDFLKALAEL